MSIDLPKENKHNNSVEVTSEPEPNRVEEMVEASENDNDSFTLEQLAEGPDSFVARITINLIMEALSNPLNQPVNGAYSTELRFTSLGRGFLGQRPAIQQNSNMNALENSLAYEHNDYNASLS